MVPGAQRSIGGVPGTLICAAMRVLYGVTTALSAFLLFSAELMATRALLPMLGGSSAVWISALAFFQLMLLLGYGYAVLLTRHSERSSKLWLAHVALVALAVFSLVLPGWTHVRPPAVWPPQLQLFALLGVSLGAPFLVLSTTTPLLQAWYARRERTAVPYRLFALSNLSSLIALLAYPILVEPYLRLDRQRIVWIVGFIVYAALFAVLTVRGRVDPGAVDDTLSLSTEPPKGLLPKRGLLWFALPAVASMQLAAVTAHLTQDVAPMPLLWVLPLIAYLLSFVLAFERPVLYQRGLVVRLLAVLLAALGYFLAQAGVTLPIVLGISFFVAELLIATWFLHAELYALRPQRTQEMTVFYLVLAAGGAAGTAAVAIFSPLITRSNFDLPVSFLLTAALAAVVTWNEGWGARALWVAATGLGCVLLIALSRSYDHDALLRARNFYGSVRVKETQLPPQAVTSRILFNGAVQHGMQWFSDDFRRTPLTYYAPDSGVGLALERCCGTAPRRIGVIGLGAGTIAAYGRAGDSLRFYEINPLVTSIAASLFTYTRETPAAVTIVPGDARLSLAKEAPQHFDVLVVDAFSGDSIPVHLLTREALDLYRRHLAPGGVIAFHISNQYLDLAPVIARLAESTQSGIPLIAREIDTRANEGRGEFVAAWVLLSERAGLFADPEIAAVATPVTTRSDVRLWTDQYSSLLPIVHWTGGH